MAQATTEHIQKELAEIANGFERITRPKWEALMPFKDSIAELRRRGASFKTIATILCRQSVLVSHDTVSRFWHEAIQGKTPKKKHKRAPTKPRVRAVRLANVLHASDSRRNGAASENPVPPRATPDKGPRIADTKDL